MNKLISLNKLPRFQYIIDNQTDKLRFIDGLVARFKTAEEIHVVDPTGLTYNYHPQLPTQSKEQALAATPLRIPKAIVDEYNEKAQADKLPDAPSIDFDSVETLKLQLMYWIEKSVLGESATFTEDDVIVITAAHGKPELGKYVYQITQNGKLDPTRPANQHRFSNPRTNINVNVLALGAKELTVKSLSPTGIIADILKQINGEDVGAANTQTLFADELILPVTHFSAGHTYFIMLAPWSLDYYGQIMVKVEAPEGGIPPVDDLDAVIPDPLITVPATISRALAVSTGITAVWANHELSTGAKVTAWTCDVDDAVISTPENITKKTAVIVLPESVLVGDVITTTLTTDKGTVSGQTTLIE